MIDAQIFRVRIGSFNMCGGGKGGKGSGKVQSNRNYNDFSAFNPCDIPYPIKFYNLNINSGICEENTISSPSKNIKTTFSSFIYFYFIILLSCCMLSLISTVDHCLPSQIVYVSFDISWKLSFVCLSHIKVGYFCLISSLILRYSCASGSISKFYRIGRCRISKTLSQLILYLLLLNFLLIGIVNPRLLNPRPDTLKIC